MRNDQCPGVVLLHWAFLVQGDLILIYYWLCSASPTGSGPCSAGSPTPVGA